MLLVMRKGYVKAPTGHLHYREAGEGPPLVLLHQTAWSSIQFSRAMPFLAASGIRCIAMDTPGFGMSDGPQDEIGIPGYAEAVGALLDGLGLERAMVFGHHTGASIACAFASSQPDRVERLILHGVPIYTDEERAARLAWPHFDQTPREDGSHFTDRWSLASRASGDKGSPEAIHWSVIQFFWAGPKEWYGHRAAFTYEIDTPLKTLTVPTMIMSNSGDTLHYKMKMMREMRPDFAFAELEGGSFHIIFDEPERWAEVVSEYVHRGLE